MLRISGAIQVIQELLSGGSSLSAEAAAGTGDDAELAAAD
jgi:hypothetical protein